MQYQVFDIAIIVLAKFAKSSLLENAAIVG